VLVGLSAAYVTSPSHFSFFYAVLALVGALAVHSGANLTNTYFDYISGLDNPSSGDPTLFTGRVTQKEVLLLGVASFSLSGVLGVYAVWTRGPVLLLPILIGGLLSIFYTQGLKYKALGEPTIFLCYGPLLTVSVTYLQLQTFSALSFFLSFLTGLHTTAILHVNNTRDIETDRRAGAITLAQKLEEKKKGLCLWVYVGLLVVPHVLVALLWFVFKEVGVLCVLLPQVVLVVLPRLIGEFERGVWSELCAKTGVYGFVFGFLLALGLVIS
jgi:1,4-dihydroxy-2-naphthoate octaprenyltransferase